MQNQHTAPLAKAQLKTFSVRLGKIFSNLSIFTMILCLCGIMSFLSLAFIWIMGIVIIIFTVGTIFVIAPNFFSLLTAVSDFTANVAAFFAQNFYIFAAITLVCAIATLVLLALDKQTRHTARIVTSSIVIGIALIAIVVFAAVV